MRYASLKRPLPKLEPRCLWHLNFHGLERMKKIPLEIIGLSYSQTQTGAYALVLGEKDGKRRLPIIIGSFEAQAIAIEMEKMVPTRPLTHDLFKKFADSFNVRVKEVVVYNLLEGIFYAKVICEDGVREVEIDSRTSDAIALAVRFDCPIFTYEFILSSAGIVIPEEDEAAQEDQPKAEPTSEKPEGPGYEKMSLQQLELLLDKSIEEEAYEKASKIRDEINRRKKDS